MNFTDEHLSAFIDGELDEEMMASVEAAIETNSEVSRRLELLRKPDGVISAVYGQINETPVPSDLMNLLNQTGEPFSVVHRPESFWRRQRHLLALAASLVVAIGGVLSLEFDDGYEDRLPLVGNLEKESPVQIALETNLSGQTLVEGALSVTPVLTFKSVNGTYCREFTANTRHESVRAIACKVSQDWSVEAVVGGTGASARGSEYRTASSDIAQFDLIVSQLMSEPALDRAAEKRLLENHFFLQ